MRPFRNGTPFLLPTETPPTFGALITFFPYVTKQQPLPYLIALQFRRGGSIPGSRKPEEQNTMVDARCVRGDEELDR